MVPLNEIERMSLAPHPMPRVLVAPPNYAQGQLDCPDRLDCASDRQHAEKGDQACPGPSMILLDARLLPHGLARLTKKLGRVT
jgi:hypothetical protein